MRYCAQCSGRLILLREKIEMIEGSRTPVTTQEYRCLDKKCQDRIDRETALRIKNTDERQKRVNLRKYQRISIKIA
ncbi:MAG: hypothetical protein A2958_01070 [Candidatus Levybacteria bacterium RIFCSPLOWO2_01_FULL_38_13]|nr:MAG: hypothetical protein A2629_00965 [Candidatus Levybacteria bacterium RIFCSPHIGHO2_01_FULL_41_15]OGH34878.1 MAG: hypothetical protein A2958_01070 [Candidatus Levybacteria bacterium RIFCSPLOWO2_01_FULL_38_13]